MIGDKIKTKWIMVWEDEFVHPTTKGQKVIATAWYCDAFAIGKISIYYPNPLGVFFHKKIYDCAMLGTAAEIIGQAQRLQAMVAVKGEVTQAERANESKGPE